MLLASQPATVACKMEAQSEYVRVAHTFFAHFSADLYAQSVISYKISASELRRKFIKSASLVGSWCHWQLPRFAFLGHLFFFWLAEREQQQKKHSNRFFSSFFLAL